MLFYVCCNDFVLERYFGLCMVLLYELYFQIFDMVNNYFKKKCVFMNYVIDYDGYCFFQFSFDEDEYGMQLSVNYDFWGINVIYFGYLLMVFGMILLFFFKIGCFRELLGRVNNKMVLLVVGFFMFFIGVLVQEYMYDYFVYNVLYMVVFFREEVEVMVKKKVYV